MRQNDRMNVEEFYRRYDAARSANDGIADTRVMELAGFKKDTMRNGRRRGASPDILAVLKAARILNVPPFHFLEPLGIGPELLKHPAAAEKTSEIIDDPDELAWVRLWRAMNKPKRPVVLAMVKGAIEADAA